MFYLLLFQTTEMANADLDKYYKALDRYYTYFVKALTRKIYPVEPQRRGFLLKAATKKKKNNLVILLLAYQTEQLYHAILLTNLFSYLFYILFAYWCQYAQTTEFSFNCLD